MKRLLLSTLLISLFLTAFTQIRVTDRSERRQPGWVNSLEKNYIIVAGSGATLQDAQQNALNMVKERIVSSVAENVQTRSEMSVQETTGTDVSFFLEEFATTTTTESGPVPFLQGISLSKVEEYYWEETENRADRSIRYNYHIKYPFNEVELWKLVEEFKKRDKEMTEQLEELLAGVDKVRSVEDIQNNMKELSILTDYFRDGRKDQAAMGINRYRTLLNNIDLVEVESGLGELKYALRLGDRYITTTRKPIIRSECARITGTRTEGEYTVVEYDYEYCYEDPENNIEVSYRFGNSSVRKPFYFDITADKASIFVSDPIRFTAGSKDNETVQSAQVSITVVSKYDTPFTITMVELEWRGVAPIRIENINRSFSGKGNHQLTLNVNQPITIETTSSKGSSISMIAGNIHFKSDVTGESKTYRIYNHTYTTDW